MILLRRLGGRIFTTFALGLILLTLLFGGIAAHFGRQLIIDSSANELRVLSVVLSQLIQRQFSVIEAGADAIRGQANLVAELQHKNADRARLEKFLGDQIGHHPFFEDLMIYDLDGRCVGATDPEWYKISGVNESFFKEGLEDFNFPSIYGSEGAAKVQLISAPIYDRSDVVGVLVGVIRLNSIYELMDQKIGLSESTDAFLLDEYLRFITPSKLGPRELVDSHLSSTALKAHLHEEQWVGEYSDYSGEKVLGTAFKISGYNWYIVIERHYSEVIRQVTAIQRLVFGVAFVLLVVFVFASLLVSRSVTKPLMQLIQSTRSIAAGNFREEVPIPRGLEEVEFLAIEFERMRRKVALSQERLMERLEESESLRREGERLAAIGTLAASLAHEIRNPLNAMSLLLSRLQGSPQDAVKESVMGDLFGEIARLDRLVSRILDYARPVQLHKSHVDITKLVSAVVELYRPVLAEKGMDVTFESSATPIMLKCDPDQVTECLVNLLKNAMEAMAHGGHLWVSISATANEVVIKVTDDGAGIAEGLQKKLFSLFVTTKLSGTGLGLSHVYKIMLAHGGRVEVESSPELAARGLAQRGATVRLEFPIYQ